MGYLKQVKARETNILLVDLGDNFKEPTRQGKLKAETMMKALARMNYDAITLGDKDLLYGNPFLNRMPDIPWVAANLQLEGLTLPSLPNPGTAQRIESTCHCGCRSRSVLHLVRLQHQSERSPDRRATGTRTTSAKTNPLIWLCFSPTCPAKREFHYSIYPEWTSSSTAILKKTVI